MVAEIGCNSRFSDEKKADLFVTKYENKEMTVAGETKELDQGEIGVRVLPSTTSFDVSVTMADPKSTYDLQKGQRVVMRFVVRRAGGCVLPFTGDQGVLVP